MVFIQEQLCFIIGKTVSIMFFLVIYINIIKYERYTKKNYIEKVQKIRKKINKQFLFLHLTR
jgi:hypothetical protein